MRHRHHDDLGGPDGIDHLTGKPGDQDSPGAIPFRDGAPMFGWSSMRETTAPTASTKVALDHRVLSSYHRTAAPNSPVADAAMQTFTG